MRPARRSSSTGGPSRETDPRPRSTLLLDRRPHNPCACRLSRSSAAGVYPVSLRVADDGGAIAETTRSVTVCPAKGGPKFCKG